MAAPMEYATVQVWRHGIQEPDYDNLFASLKGLMDVLQPVSKRHPYGCGVILNDSPKHVYTRIHHVQAQKRVDQHTRVVIREVSEAMFHALTLEKAA